MHETEVTVSQNPVGVTIQTTDSPLAVTINSVGTQGPQGGQGIQGPIGPAGTGSSLALAVTGLSVNSGVSLTGLLNLSYAGSVVLTTAGNDIKISGSASTTEANVTDVIYTSGFQTVSGNKLFQSGNIYLKTGDIIGSGRLDLNSYIAGGYSNLTVNSGVRITTSGIVESFNVNSSSVGQLLNIEEDVNGLIFQVNQSGIPFLEVYSDNLSGSVKLGNTFDDDFIVTGGYVGVGTGTPQYKLDVNGYVEATSGVIVFDMVTNQRYRIGVSGGSVVAKIV